MTKAKKRILMAASYVAVAAVAIGGTLAFFTDSTDPVTNVRTVGDVEIVQHEYQRAEGESHINPGAVEGDLVPFEQGQMIMPAVPANGLASDYSAEQANDRQFWWGEYTNGVGSNGLWDDSKISNVMDKFVFVENTGDSAAYYRTIIAFECPDGVTYGEASQGADFMLNTNGNSRFTWDGWELVDINGTQYAVTTALYNEVLEAGEISRPSLLQIVMTHNADNETAEALGDTYEVLVISQAVQADKNADPGVMLDDAFGEVNAANAAIWFADSVTVAAPEAGAVRPAGYAPAAEGETIDNLVVVDESDDTTNLRALYKNGLTGSVTVTNSYLDGTYAMNLTVDKNTTDAVLTVEDTALRGWVSYSGFASASFTDCSFAENSNPEIYNTIRPYDETVFTNCEFTGTEFWLDKLDGATITLVNCTLNGVEITSADQLNIVYGDASSVVIG